MLALLLSCILLLANYYEDRTLELRNIDNFSFLNKMTVTDQPSLLVVGLHVT